MLEQKQINIKIAVTKAAVHKRRHHSKGRCWVYQKMILFSKSLFSKSDDEGGVGVKNLKILMTSFMESPKPVFYLTF